MMERTTQNSAHQGNTIPGRPKARTYPGTTTTTGTSGKLAERIAVVIELETFEVGDVTPNTPLIATLSRLLGPANEAHPLNLTLIYLTSEPEFSLPASSTGSEKSSEMVTQYLIERNQKQRDHEDAFRKTFEQNQLPITTEQAFNLQGRNLQPVLDFIANTHQDLLVLYEGNTTAHQDHTHSHAMRHLAAHAPISTLILRRSPKHETGPLNILFGVDDSEATLNATRKLGDILHPVATALTVATVQSPIYQENAVLAPFVNQDVLDEALDNNARMIFEMVRDILDTKGLTVTEQKKMIGSPATELGYLASQTEPDLVVVGSRNRKGLFAWLLGSVSFQLLHWDVHNLLIIR